jgi:hypothetical protein
MIGPPWNVPVFWGAVWTLEGVPKNEAFAVPVNASVPSATEAARAIFEKRVIMLMMDALADKDSCDSKILLQGERKVNGGGRC